MQHGMGRANGGNVNKDIVGYLRSLRPASREVEVKKLVTGWLSYQSKFTVGSYTFGGGTVVIVVLSFGQVLMTDEGGNRVLLEVRPVAIDLEEAYTQVPIRREREAGMVCFFLANS
jgi:hypothetical protein